MPWWLFSSRKISRPKPLASLKLGCVLLRHFMSNAWVDCGGFGPCCASAAGSSVSATAPTVSAARALTCKAKRYDITVLVGDRLKRILPLDFIKTSGDAQANQGSGVRGQGS